jgi:hypothetical protein
MKQLMTLGLLTPTGRRIAALCILALGLVLRPATAHAEGAPVHKGKFSCNLKSLTPAQRAEQQAMSSRLCSAVTDMKELDDGYAFRIDLDKIDLKELAAWIDLERRCCSFMRFAIEVEANEGGVWLRLTGAEGVKDFLRDEIASRGQR